jgi:acyl-CoA thioester hydrolase
MRLKDDARRLQAFSYSLKVEIRALFSHMDAFRVINNVALASYFEEGRADMNVKLFGAQQLVNPKVGTQLVFAGMQFEFIEPVLYPGSVEVRSAISRIGRSSYVQSSALFRDDRCLALCDCTTVLVINRVAAELPKDVVSKLEGFLLKA